MSSRYDCAVLGGGVGGYVAAIRLGQLGRRVALIERHRLGGECLNYGCIPTKTWINTVKLAYAASHSANKGITGDVHVDLKQLKTWKDDAVKRLVNGIESLCRSNRVDVVYGVGNIAGKNAVEVVQGSNTRIIEAENIIVATGSKPIVLPGFEYDHANIVDNHDVLEFTDVPKSLCVIGGGAIGLEFAFLFSKLGSKVTVVELMDQLLPGTDKEVAALIYRSAVAHSIDVHLEARAKSWSRVNNLVRLVFAEKNDEEKWVECEKVLVSVGRRPNTDGLGLEKLGVERDKAGYIRVDSRLRTNVEGVFAVGDVTPGPMLAHRASRQGEVAAEVIAGLNSEFDNVGVPNAVFTDPEVATVGLTAEEAAKAGYDVSVGRFPYLALGRAVSVGETDGFVKVVADAKSGAILGVQIVGSEASDMISEASLALEMGATLEDIGSTIHPHPTFPEALFEAAKHAQGKAIHVVNRPRGK
ncbi:MAG: dihydrolipoyl dehydrogenase [Thermoprotei archaeon]